MRRGAKGVRAAVLGAALVCAAFCGGARAATIKILWYTYAAPTSAYRAGVVDLASQAAALPQSAGAQWQVEFFAPGDAPPDFTAYNVLVIHSGEAFLTGASPTDPNLVPDFSGILNNKLAIEGARGERTFVSGSDADFHAVRGDSGSCDPVRGCFLYDGARGYVVNAINWAGSGRGLGVVSFYHGEFSGSFWWDHPDSFLRAELSGRFSAARDNQPPTLQDLPLNRGLTPAGLSNWINAFHGRFSEVPGYVGVQFAAGASTQALSIASAAFAGAPAGPAPLLQFELANYETSESGAAVTLKVTREENALGAVSVDFSTRNGAAVATADFTTIAGTISFADGDRAAKIITVPITNDAAAEGAETFSVELGNAGGGAQIGARAAVSVRIDDDDSAAPSGGGGGGCALRRASGGDGTLALLAAAAWLALLRRRRTRPLH